MRLDVQCTLQACPEPVEWSAIVRASLTLRSAVEGAGVRAELRHGRAEQALAGSVQQAMLAHLGAHTCICAASSCRRDKASADMLALHSRVSLLLVSPIASPVRFPPARGWPRWALPADRRPACPSRSSGCIRIPPTAPRRGYRSRIERGCEASRPRFGGDDGMVRGAQGPFVDQGLVRRQHATHRVDLGDFQSLVNGQRPVRMLQHWPLTVRCSTRFSQSDGF
jgi:hypothetical protein